LLVVVPAEGRLEIEGMVSPRHRLRPSRAKGEIKIDTFTRYGLLQGVVLSCDRPRQAADKTGDKVPGAETATSEPKGLCYAARVLLDRSQMQRLIDKPASIQSILSARLQTAFARSRPRHQRRYPP
jgi:hypothetical protein